MTSEVQGGGHWKAEVAEGSREWRLTFDCPTCNGHHVLLLQPPPWRAPTDHVTEDRRRAGAVKFRDLDGMPTQLWCHRCGHGQDVVVTLAA